MDYFRNTFGYRDDTPVAIHPTAETVNKGKSEEGAGLRRSG